jgi:hypothetical protein
VEDLFSSELKSLANSPREPFTGRGPTVNRIADGCGELGGDHPSQDKSWENISELGNAGNG